MTVRYFIFPLFVITFLTKMQWEEACLYDFFNELSEEEILLFVKIY